MKTAKKMFGILTVTAALAVQVHAQSFLTNGLVAYYPFNGNADDASGNGNNATTNTATLTADRFGNANSAYTFNFSEIYVPYSPAFNSQQITVSAWINNAFFSDGDSQAIVTRLQHGYSDPSGQVWWWGINNDQGQVLHLQNSSLDDISLEASPFETNTWTMASFSYDGTLICLYTNGILASQMATNNFVLNAIGDSGLSIGVDDQANGLFSWFYGAIDDVRIYNRALSSNEVAQLYAYESVPEPAIAPTNGLVAYYPFNGNANDESGNGNNGTVYGAALSTNRFGQPSSAFDFNGTSSVITITNHILNTGQTGYTIQLWFKSNSQDQNAPNPGGVMFDNLSGIGIGIGWAAYYVPSGYVGYDIGAGSDWDLQINPAHDPYQLATWYCVTLIKSDTVYSFYLNGQLLDTQTNSAAAAYNFTDGFYIGSSYWNEFFNGSIDDVRIYNRALAPWEVQELYQFESTRPPTPPAITSQPQSILVKAHDTATFNVTATGTDPLAYQWLHAGTNLPNATSSTLTIANARPFNVGAYRVVITNNYGAVTSSVANLSLNPNYAGVSGPYLGVSITVSNSLQNVSKYTNGITTTANPTTSRLVATNILTLLAFDERVAGNWPSNSFPKNSTLALASGRFVVVNGTNLLLDVSDIMTFTNYLPQIHYGKLNNSNGLASPSLTTVQMAALAFDDTLISGGKNYQFYLAGVLTQTKTDTTPLNKKYTETITQSLSSGAGDGSILGVPFICTGTFSATATSSMKLSP